MWLVRLMRASPTERLIARNEVQETGHFLRCLTLARTGVAKTSRRDIVVDSEVILASLLPPRSLRCVFEVQSESEIIVWMAQRPVMNLCLVPDLHLGSRGLAMRLRLMMRGKLADLQAGEREM